MKKEPLFPSAKSGWGIVVWDMSAGEVGLEKRRFMCAPSPTGCDSGWALVRIVVVPLVLWPVMTRLVSGWRGGAGVDMFLVARMDWKNI